MSIASTHQSLKAKDNFVIISGCSGSGKSTLLEALKAQGKTVIMEAGRQVVKQQMALGLDGLPWENSQHFVELCVAKNIEDFDSHSSTKDHVFFDRSLIEFAKGETLCHNLGKNFSKAMKKDVIVLKML